MDDWTDADLEAYDELIGEIQPAPDVSLDLGQWYCLRPSQLKLFRRTRLTGEFHISRLDLERASLEDYMNALAEGHHRPQLWIGDDDEDDKLKLSVSQLSRLFNSFPVDSLSLLALDLTEETAQQYFDLIVEKHLREPIVCVEFQEEELKYFTAEQRAKFKEISLLFEPNEEVEVQEDSKSNDEDGKHA